MACLDITRPYDDAPGHATATESDLDGVVAEIEALGRKALAVRADVSDEAQVDDGVAAAAEALGTVMLVANVAGGSGPGVGLGPLTQVPAAEYRRVL